MITFLSFLKNFVLFLKILFVYLAALGLSCIMWDLSCGARTLVVARSLSCFMACGVLAP